MECIPASPRDLKTSPKAAAIRGNSLPRRSFPDTIPTAPRHTERLQWTCSSFRAEAMQQDKYKVQARNDALQEVVRQLEADLKDCRQQLAEKQAESCKQNEEISSLKQKLEATGRNSAAQPSLTDDIVRLLEALPAQSKSIEPHMKSVLDRLPLSDEKKSKLLAKQTKRPGYFKRLFSLNRANSVQ